MATIYLSSTYEDLKEHRSVVFQALRKSGYDVIAMEDYVATEQCAVDKASILIGCRSLRWSFGRPHGIMPGQNRAVYGQTGSGNGCP